MANPQTPLGGRGTALRRVLWIPGRGQILPQKPCARLQAKAEINNKTSEGEVGGVGNLVTGI